MSPEVTIETPRFLIRELRESDLTPRYLAWFADPRTAENIDAAVSTTSIADLQRYLAERAGRDDVLFLGIFERSTGVHVGNVKYEPLDAARGYAVMGMLIGEPAWRGKGVAGEVLAATAAWLKSHRGIAEIVLGVDSANEAAIRAYAKTGFVMAETPHIALSGPEHRTMVWRL